MNLQISKTRRRRRTELRSGAAVVEAAICFPMIVIIMLGTLEICSGYYVKESLSVAAFEGIRTGTRRRATAEDVRERLNEVLADRQIIIPASDPNASIVITPSDFTGLDALSPITVTVTAPTAGNSIFIFDSMVNRYITASVTMVREFDE